MEGWRPGGCFCERSQCLLHDSGILILMDWSCGSFDLDLFVLISLVLGFDIWIVFVFYLACVLFCFCPALFLFRFTL